MNNFNFLGETQQNPFALAHGQSGLLSSGFGQSNTGQMGGLLGRAFQQQPEPQDQYAQMASPYANWAAQQLQQVTPQAPATSQQFISDPQQQALSQMWDFYQQKMNPQPNGWASNDY